MTNLSARQRLNQYLSEFDYSVFEEASRLQLRLTSSHSKELKNKEGKLLAGEFSTEDLWSFSNELLIKIASDLETQLNSENKPSFLIETTTPNKVDSEKRMLYSIIVYIVNYNILTAKANQEEKIETANKKQQIEFINQAIAQKKAEAIGSKTLEELQAELNSLR